MSQAPYQPPPAQSFAPAHPPNSNVLGLVGFILSLIGLLLTCGLLSPLGLLISLAGLLKPPRGMAITGTILGLIGTGFLATIGFGFIMSVLAIAGFGKMVGDEIVTRDAITKARNKIEEHRAAKNELPDGVEGNKLILEFKDAWKHELRYDGEEGGSGRFVIRSAGADGKFDTTDDVVVGESPTLTSPDIQFGDPSTSAMPDDGDDEPAPFDPGSLPPKEQEPPSIDPESSEPSP